VEPYLRTKSKTRIVSRVLRIFGMGESAVAQEIQDLIEEQTSPTIATYASVGEVTIRLTVKCEEGDDAEALFAPVEAEIRSRIGKYVYATGDDLPHILTAKLLGEKGVTVAVAESLTGGRVLAQLVDYPGVSQTLLCGVVAYSNQSKMDILGVEEETLKAYGAVSAQTAIEMAEGMRRISGADIAISTTGIAGPTGATAEKPVGLTYIGVCDQNGSEAFEFRFNRDRERNRHMACLNAFSLLRGRLLQK
jgi:nicotinamide-nucleotide amidase